MSSCRKQERCLHRNTTVLASPFRAAFAATGTLEAPAFVLSDNSRDDNYTSREDMIQDVQDYTGALDVDANDPTQLLIPMQALPGGYSPGGVTPSHTAGITVLLCIRTCAWPETVPAPAPAPVAPQATAMDTNRYAMQPGVRRTVTRNHVRSPVATEYRAYRNNNAAVTGIFQEDTLQQVHKLGFRANLDIAHHLDDTFSTEYTYATTNTQGSFLVGEIKETIPNTFKEAMGLPQAALWKAASGRQVASLETTASTSWYQLPQSRQDRG